MYKQAHQQANKTSSRLPIKRASNTDARLSRGGRIKRNIVIQFRRLGRNLRSSVLALSLLNLQPQHLKLQLQHLVLDLAILQCGSVATGSGELVVEATGTGLGGFGDEAGVLDNGQIGGCYTGEVGRVNLMTLVGFRALEGGRHEWKC